MGGWGGCLFFIVLGEISRVAFAHRHVRSELWLRGKELLAFPVPALFHAHNLLVLKCIHRDGADE